jgi:alginate O-acetyltransferase complex protein AlgI
VTTELAARAPTARPHPALAWGLMLALIAGVIAIGPRCSPLERMTLAMAAHLVGFKLLTIPRRRVALYFAWPGMDARAFDGPLRPDVGACQLVARGCVFAAAGLALLAVPLDGIARAWLGVVALLMIVHLGSFDALAGLFRWNGLPVERICPDPWLSRSLTEFWGRRWNRAFHAVALDHVYRPLARRCGPTAAVAVVFLFSGLVHELVVSFPAGGGWGLPTLYFALHGALVALEKRGLLRPSRALTLAAVLVPLPLLFHPPFLLNCVLPLVSR